MYIKEKVQVSIRIDKITNSKLKELAVRDNRTRSRMISVLLKNAVKEYECENGEIIIDETIESN